MNITISDLTKALIRKWYICIIFVISTSLIGFVVSEFLIAKEYTSASRAYVFVDAEEDAKLMTEKTAAMHCVAQVATPDIYRTIAKNLAAKNLGSFSYAELMSSIEVSQPNEEINLVDFKCNWRNATEAQTILTEFNNVMTQTLANLPFQKQTIVMTVQVQPDFKASPSSPNVVLITLASMFLGIILAVIVVMLLEFGNSKLRNAQDVQTKLSLAVLGEIPLMRNSGRLKVEAK